jgi:hypothetical protein
MPEVGIDEKGFLAKASVRTRGFQKSGFPSKTAQMPKSHFERLARCDGHRTFVLQDWEVRFEELKGLITAE